MSEDAKNMDYMKEKKSEVYDGAENPIIADFLQQAKFQCSFNSQDYPFGDQNCSFSLLLIGSQSCKEDSSKILGEARATDTVSMIF